jgi:hypothetical protein
MKKKKSAAKKSAPKKAATKKAVKKAVVKKAAPKKTVKKVIKKKAAPQKATPKKATPKKAAPKKIAKAPAKAKATAKPRTAHLAAVTTLYRAWCDTQSVWISPDWTTLDQANADAQTHIGLGHLVEVKQKVG